MDVISPYKSCIGNSKRDSHRFISGFPVQSSKFQENGGSQASPPFISHSYPQFSLQQPPLPPLLPLPAANHQRGAATRGLSSTLNSRKLCNSARTRDSSRTPKKAKSSNHPMKENGVSSPKKPAPILLSEKGAKVLPFMILSDNNGSIRSKKHGADQRDKFSGSVTFAVSPPPSSLPLPTFSLRPKLRCMMEASGIDSGATDNLRKLLRIL